MTSLQARCAVIAAANPIRGRYDVTVPFSSNVQLTEPILSRFDVLCVVKDTVNPVDDERLAKFVVASHVLSHPQNSKLSPEDRDALRTEMMPSRPTVVPQDVFKKYLKFAKARIIPQLTSIDRDKMAEVYTRVRQESVVRMVMVVVVCIYS